MQKIFISYTSAEKNKTFHHRPSHSEDIPSACCTSSYILFPYKLLSSTIPKIILLALASRVCKLTNKDIPSVNKFFQRKICTTVFKCLNDDVPNFEDYFESPSLGKGTRNNNTVLRTPKIKLESTKKAFFSNGAVV